MIFQPVDLAPGRPGLSFIKACGAQHGLQMGLGVHLEGLRGTRAAQPEIESMEICDSVPSDVRVTRWLGQAGLTIVNHVCTSGS